jgi:tRNA pseudouridine55 synthase
VRVDCGRGTYIRALARELGEALAAGGYLTALRRTRIGPFHVEEAVTLEALTADTLPGRLGGSGKWQVGNGK